MSQTKIFTSYFGRLKQFPPSLEPIAICAGPPRWYKGRVMSCLAPTRPMIKMGPAQYIPLYEGILARLNPEDVLKEIGNNAILLCWESSGEFCHRRMVARWLEENCDIEVPELMFSKGRILNPGVV